MLVDFTISDESLKEFGRRFRAGKEKNVKDSLANIKREWQAEFIRQQRRLQNVWTPLEKKYGERKTHEYYSAKGKLAHGNTSGQVRYNTILRRTGVMLAGYISGIQIDEGNYSVSIPFPEGAAGVRAKSHQGVIGLPPGVKNIRPWDTDKFVKEAEKQIREALLK